MQFSCDCGNTWKPRKEGSGECFHCGEIPTFIIKIDRWRITECALALKEYLERN